jgi:hypothetical protein
MRKAEHHATKLRFVFATVLVIAAFIALNSWAAVPKHESAALTTISADRADFVVDYPFHTAAGTVCFARLFKKIVGGYI